MLFNGLGALIVKWYRQRLVNVFKLKLHELIIIYFCCCDTELFDFIFVSKEGKGFLKYIDD